MGSFLTNITLHGPTQAEVAAAVRELLPECEAYISPSRNGWVTFYGDSFEDQDAPNLIAAAADLCEHCGADGFASLVHDSDVLLFWVIAKDGGLIAEYNSCPGYFSDEEDADVAVSTEEIAEALAGLSGGGVLATTIAAVLTAEDAFAEETLEAVGEVLGAADLGVGFDILQEDEANNGEIVSDWEQFVHVEPK
jgi:hypothetical protein